MSNVDRSQHHLLPLSRGAFLVLVVATIGGCSSAYPKAEVTGRVMCGDKPAWGGVVTFQPLDASERTGNPPGNPGGVSRGKVEEDGTFRLTYEARGGDAEEDGAVIGPHRVTFIMPMTEKRKWSNADNWIPEEDKVRLQEQMANEPVYPKLACGNEITPGEIEVKAGSNDFAFTLKVGAFPTLPSRPTGSD
jgi:hypothetical protein